MFSHLASNDTTAPLSFVSGWMVNSTIALRPGAYAAYGVDGKAPWIDLDTDAGLIRLVNVEYQVKAGKPPSGENASFYFFPVWQDQYLKVAKDARVARVFSHTHQASFDNVYGDGKKPTVEQVIGRHPVDLLGDSLKLRIDGTSAADYIVLNDTGGTVYSNNGGDRVNGGDGADLMYGANGRDSLYGGDGRDKLYGGNNNDRIYGGGDNDKLYGDAGDDTLKGGDGEDRLFGLWQNDKLYGDADKDWLYGGDNNDRLYGGIGEDTLKGGNDKDRLYGGIDNDKLYGGNHNDRLNGGIGQDELYGGKGNDRLYGGDDNDPLFGNGGNDLVYGGIGQDYLYGGKGKDRLNGGDDNDWLYGGKGNDRLYGGIANDFLYGGDGKDRLNGKDDNDRLDGGPGSDVLTGGRGSDTFVFSARLGPHNVDRITDFVVGTDGRIALSAKIFKHLPKGDLPASYFERGGAAHDKKDHVIYDPRKGLLIYDENGSKAGGEHAFAKIDKHLSLSNSDFMVI